MADIADSSALLSTMAGAGATLVAIIGGFLVSRYVSLDSEQQGAKRKLHEVTERLDAVRTEHGVARAQYRRNRAYEAVNDAHILAMLCREYVLSQAARNADSAAPDVASDEDVLRTVENVADIDIEIFSDVLSQVRGIVGAALAFLTPIMNEHAAVVSDAGHLLGWSDVRQEYDLRVSELEQSPWIFVWEEWLRPHAVGQVEKRRRRESLGTPGFVYVPSLALSAPAITEWQKIQMAVSSDGEAELNRLEDEIKALGVEQRFTRRAYEAIGRPTGLLSGILVLASLALLQGIPPILFLAPTPAALSMQQAVVLLAVFGAGLLVLFGYLYRYASRLGLTARPVVSPPPATRPTHGATSNDPA